MTRAALLITVFGAHAVGVVVLITRVTVTDCAAFVDAARCMRPTVVVRARIGRPAVMHGSAVDRS
jgi:hypothetical protein